MRLISATQRVAGLLLGLCASHAAVAAGQESLLLESINQYRGQAQRCADQASAELPPLNSDPRLVKAAGIAGELQQVLSAAAYPMVTVQAISLSGPRDAQAAMAVVRDSFCHVVLDPQFIDIGIYRQDREWRVVLARPLLTARLGDWQAEGQQVLQMINAARAQPRRCATQSFGATHPLVWSDTLASAALNHSRSMANQNFFDHRDRNGGTPGDRAEIAGYTGLRIGENIAAGQDTAGKVLDGWLASPGHCANLMNPDFRELGAAYANDPKSDAGIYWTAVFGTPMN